LLRQKLVLIKICSKPTICLQLLEERSAAVKKSKKPKRKKKGGSDAAPPDADQANQSGVAQPCETQPLSPEKTGLPPQSTASVASQDRPADPLSQPLPLEATELSPAGSNPYVEKPQLSLEAAVAVLASGDPSKDGPTDAQKLLFVDAWQLSLYAAITVLSSDDPSKPIPVDVTNLAVTRVKEQLTQLMATVTKAATRAAIAERFERAVEKQAGGGDVGPLVQLADRLMELFRVAGVAVAEKRGTDDPSEASDARREREQGGAPAARELVSATWQQFMGCEGRGLRRSEVLAD
jgi:hypothetical protein